MDHWAQVLGQCYGEDGDYTYESESVKVIRADWRLSRSYSRLLTRARTDMEQRSTAIGWEGMYRWRWCRFSGLPKRITWRHDTLNLWSARWQESQSTRLAFSGALHTRTSAKHTRDWWTICPCSSSTSTGDEIAYCNRIGEISAQEGDCGRRRSAGRQWSC